MIIKKRYIPLIILILEALLRRLVKNHPKRPIIMEDLEKWRSGFWGEESIDFYLGALPEKDYHIFHDLNFQDGDFHHQIDTFLLSPQRGIIIDVKNYTAKIFIDTDTEQLVQKTEDREKPYPYPIAQVERHQRFIRKLLAEYNFPAILIDYLVVFSNTNAILHFTGRNSYKVQQHICKSPSLFNKIKTFENLYKTEILSPKDLRRLSKLLLKLNTPPTIAILQRYGIQKWELLLGVHCPVCNHLPIQRKDKNWFCPSCDKCVKEDALVTALQDYFLLIGPTITNKQFREFARVDSPDVSGRLLRSANLNCSGTNKGRIYYPDEIPWRKS
ncbi:NERD domain-containing protein [Neobacillus niacini]|uniref:NERD domain-containing protein n=1 Tax=Neobacillus niacini TaxID=86668 RepID=UPI0021CB3444|nr:NERD domain-containing protein [Neobacillus niacini]MCM3764304.1 NERD domain-containing protein [Neobacillus niacini]